MPTKAMVKRNIVIDKKYKFQLEIYLGLDCHDDITWEIFPEDDKGKKQDILKAIHFLEMIIERDYNENS